MSKDISVSAGRFEELLRRFMFTWRSRNAVHLGETTLTQFTTMALLDDKGEVTMSQLAEGLGVTKAAVTGVVDKLVRAGHVERRHDTADRRVVKIKLTAEGRDEAHRIVGAMFVTIERIFGRMEPGELAHLLETFRNFVEFAEQVVVEPPPEENTP